MAKTRRPDLMVAPYFREPSGSSPRLHTGFNACSAMPMAQERQRRHFGASLWKGTLRYGD